jgi:integrase
MRKPTPAQKVHLDYVMQFLEGKHMLQKVAAKTNTAVAYSKAVTLLCDFLHKNPSEIVQDYQREVKASSYEAFDKWETAFDDFAIFLSKDKGYGSGTVALYHNGARALINANVPRSLRLQAKTPTATSRTIAGVSFEDLKQIYAMSDVRERAIIAFLKDSGMSKSDALVLNVGILENFERGDEFIRLKVFREKEGVEYETFLGPNAVEALRAYFALRRSRGENLTAESPLFVIVRKPFNRMDDITMSTALQRLTRKSGKVISSHRLRKFFETYMALVVRHPIILKYWMGHKVSRGRDIESRYIIPPTPEQLKLYKESYHNIDLMGATLEERAKQAAREQFEAMLTPEQKEFARSRGLKYMRKNRPKVTEECKDGEHCERLVDETELANLLSEGWHVNAVLASGKIVISR